MFKYNSHCVWPALLLATTAISVQSENYAAAHEALEKPLNTLQRDQMVSEMLGQMGSTLRCLLNILDADINEKLNRLWDGNLERVQKEAIFKLSDDQFMDLVYEKTVLTLKDIQAIHPQCAKAPYPYDNHGQVTKKLKASKEIEELRDSVEGIGNTMKCLLGPGKVDTRIHSVYAKSFVRYHGSQDASKTSLYVTKEELVTILSELKKLESKCEMVDIVNAPQTLEASHNTLQRDQLVGEMMGQMGSTLRCLLNILDADINEKLNRLWEGNLERVQKEAIFKLTDDQFMDLVYQKATITLNDMQFIHQQCGSIPYPCGHFNKLKASKDTEDLRDFLEGIGATMNCILANDKPDTRIHSIYAKSFVRYHGSQDASQTSLLLTKQELGTILLDLKNLERNCQMISVGEEPCYRTTSTGANSVTNGELRCSL